MSETLLDKFDYVEDRQVTPELLERIETLKQEVFGLKQLGREQEAETTAFFLMHSIESLPMETRFKLRAAEGYSVNTFLRGKDTPAGYICNDGTFTGHNLGCGITEYTSMRIINNEVVPQTYADVNLVDIKSKWDMEVIPWQSSSMST